MNIAQDAIINDLIEFFSDRKKLNPKLAQGVFIDKVQQSLVRSGFSGFISSKTHSSLDLIESMPDIEKSIEAMLEKKAGTNETCRSFYSEILKRRKALFFQKAVNSFLASKRKSEYQSTFKRLSRRIKGQKGKLQEKKQRVLLALDTSGSMLDEETILKLKKTIEAALVNEFSIDLILGDTKKQGFFKAIGKTFDFSQLKGGGGTDLSFIFNERLKDYDGTIILTDGEFSHDCIKAKKQDLFFLLTCEGHEAKKLADKFRAVFI